MLNEWQNERIKAWLRYKAETLKRSKREKCLRDAVGSGESAGERGEELARCRLAGCLLFWSSVSPPGLPARRGFPWLTSTQTYTHTHTPFTVTSKSTHIVNPTFTRATYKTRNIFNLLSVSTILCLSFPRSPAYLHLCGTQKALVSRPILQLFFQHSRGESLRKSERHLAAMSFNSTHAFFLLFSACSFW